MTPRGPNGDHTPAGTERSGLSVLHEAALDLRARTDQRWVEVSDRVVSAALTASRRSYPVRAMAPGGPVHVSEQVVVAKLRDRIDSEVAGVAASDLHLRVRDRDVLVGVVIQLVARYGLRLIPLADRVRVAAAESLAELLGPVAVDVDVAALHVHYADVTVDDPQGRTDALEPS